MNVRPQSCKAGPDLLLLSTYSSAAHAASQGQHQSNVFGGIPY